MSVSRYIEQLRNDSEELRKQRTRMQTEQHAVVVEPAVPGLLVNDMSNSPNTLISDASTSASTTDSVLPIHIGETASTVFAARVCQCLTGSDTSTHPLRWNYVAEADLAALLKQETPWPGHAQARLLVQTALTNVNPAFHFGLRRETFRLLDEVYQKKKFGSVGIKSKFFSLFALGQLYSAFPDAGHSHVPGSAYFAQALRLMQIPPERPSMMHLETMLSVVCVST